MAQPVTKQDFKDRLAQCGWLSYDDAIVLLDSILFYADTFKTVATYAAMIAEGKPDKGVTFFTVLADESHGGYEDARYEWYADGKLLWVATTTIKK